jgi:hypothetical protein
MDVFVIEQDPMVDGAGSEGEEAHRKQELTMRLDEFAWRATTEESARLGVSAQELATFALLYYLADLDSGRIAREIPPRGGEEG